MKRVRSLLIGLVMILGFTASPVLAWYDHQACNCWDGDYICTYEDENHNIIGYAWYQDGC